MRQFIKYFWGTIVHPRATFDALAAENTIRWAMILACLPVLQVWGNMANPARDINYDSFNFLCSGSIHTYPETTNTQCA